ncbi:MAG: thiamine phosphate synthase [Thermodesulfovibrionales bacterium]|nr:thiamine phosphate synthase [Thermodesulfovibrionales bacterium]
MKKLPRLCFITPDNWEINALLNTINLILEAGVRWVQYRDKKNTKKTIYQNALYLRELTKKYDALLSINDYLDVALAVEAEGVHLGQDDLPLEEAKKIVKNLIIGVSTHSLDEALEAEKAKADYIGFGPVYHTTTKDAGKPKGVQVLREVTSSIKIPVFAIGGINLTNLEEIAVTKIYGVAISSGLLQKDIKENAQRYLNILKRIKEL